MSQKKSWPRAPDEIDNMGNDDYHMFLNGHDLAEKIFGLTHNKIPSAPPKVGQKGKWDHSRAFHTGKKEALWWKLPRCNFQIYEPVRDSDGSFTLCKQVTDFCRTHRNEMRTQPALYTEAHFTKYVADERYLW